MKEEFCISIYIATGKQPLLLPLALLVIKFKSSVAHLGLTQVVPDKKEILLMN